MRATASLVADVVDDEDDEDDNDVGDALVGVAVPKRQTLSVDKSLGISE